MEFRFFQQWAQTLVSTKSVVLVILRVWPPSQTSVGIEQMDSKQEVFGPSDVQAHLQCAALIISSAYKQRMTKVSFQLLVRRLGPDRSSDEKFHSTQGASQCLMEVLQIDRHSFRKRTSSAQSCFLYRVRWPLPKHTTVDTQTLKYVSLVYIEVVLFCNIRRFACVAFVPPSIW